MKTITTKIVFGLFCAGSITLLTQSCSTAKEVVQEIVEELTESNESEDLSYLYRLRKCTLDASGNVQVVPVTRSSVVTKNVHVITHGWAPGYLKAVNEYASSHSGEFLLAWDSLAVNSSGDRFFVGAFFNLAKSILNADAGATVLVFSWIDQSATSMSGEDPWKDYDQMCQAEDNTQVAADEMLGGLEIAIDWSVKHDIHLLGHSYGSKVVSHTGIGLKGRIVEPGYNYPIGIIQLSLFDSPEKVYSTCANNNLCEILPAFAPDRKRFFVANYISYFDKCLSDCSRSLYWVIDATVLPYKGMCEREDLFDCTSYKHEAGVWWYAAATNDPSSNTALWWTPMKSLKLSEGTKRYQLKPSSEPIKMQDTDQHCSENKIVDCR